MASAPISLLEAFEELRDPRARECAYQLEELLLVAICAVISGAESWTSVVEWSEMKLDWLRGHLPFAKGIASHDTFRRVFSLLDAKQFEACSCAGSAACAHHSQDSTWPLMANACAVRMMVGRA